MNDDHANIAASPAAELLDDNSGAKVASERRVEERVPLNCGFHVVPLDRRGRPIHAASFTAMGKNISKSGIALSHLVEMQYPRALLTSMQSSSNQLQLEAEVAWTGPTSTGVYETGFKVICKIA